MAQREETSMSSNTGITPRPGGGFQAQVWDAKAGKRISRTFPTRSAAKRWRSDASSALRAGELSAGRGPLLDDALDEWLDGLRAGHVTNRSGDPYKPGTVRSYEKELRLRVRPVLGRVRVAEVSAQGVQRLVDGLVRAGLAPATVDVAITPLKAFYRRALGRGEVRVNPTVGIEAPAVRSERKRVVAPGDAELMVAALEPAERALWATAMYAGLRRGELIGLRREDVDLATGVLHVRRGWDMDRGRGHAQEPAGGAQGADRGRPARLPGRAATPGAGQQPRAR
jgi:integrase